MIIDLENERNFNRLENDFDVCIVGAGPAGIVIADELSKSEKKIALCEAGGMDFDEKSQSVYEGSIEGDDFLGNLREIRLRFFGGTTGHWEGYCRPFTPNYFNRDYFEEEHFRWPIEVSEINQYKQNACDILDIGSDFDDDLDSSKLFRKINYKFSPGGFGQFRVKFLNRFETAENLQLFINANLVDIAGKQGEIETAEFSNYRNKRVKLRSKVFVFAMGGIENSRYMLWFSNKYGNKFFDRGMPIGKYWMEHPHYYFVGVSVLKNEIAGNPLEKFNSFYLNDAILRENKVLSCNVMAVAADQNIQNRVFSEIHRVAPGFVKRNLSAETGEFQAYYLNLVTEQQPFVDNSVTLSPNQNDRFGIPRVVLRWKMTEMEHQAIRLAFSKFVDFILDSNYGRIKLNSNILEHNAIDEQLYRFNEGFGTLAPGFTMSGGYHHMGGLRMFENNRYGVVDKNCRVFGSKNLFVAGSSIFTTGGVGNPTLPIIQFSLRLSDHLKEII